MRNNKAIILVSVLLLLIVGGYIYYFVERYEYEHETGLSAEAKKNPFLAATYFVRELQREVVTDSGLIDWTAISTNDVVMLANIDKILVTQEQVTGAVMWMQNGGYLVGGVGQESQGYASLLAEFLLKAEFVAPELSQLPITESQSASESLRRVNQEIERRNEQRAQRDQEKGESASSDSSSLSEIMEEWSQPKDRYSVVLESSGNIDVRVEDRIVLRPLVQDEDWPYPLKATASSELGIKLMQFAVGDGYFTALSSTSMWTNANIGYLDNAHLLAALIPDDARLKIYFDLVSPSLTELILEHFLELVVLLLLMLGIWICSSWQRTQPLKHGAAHKHRSFAEHISAGARFMTQHQQFQVLADAVTTDVLVQLKRRHTGIDEHDQQAMIKLFVAEFGLSESAARQWWQTRLNIKTQDQLDQVVDLSQHVLKRLQ